MSQNTGKSPKSGPDTGDMLMVLMKDLATAAVEKGHSSDEDAIKYAVNALPFLPQKSFFPATYLPFVAAARAMQAKQAEDRRK
jgi:hypothetical protein